MNNEEDRYKVSEFFKKHFFKSEYWCGLSSSRLKNVIQHTTGIYMEESEFIELMEEAGYKRSAKGKWGMIISIEFAKAIKKYEQ